MYKSIKFDKSRIKPEEYLVGQKIIKIEYLENYPLEDDSLKIIFADNSYFLIYAITRIIIDENIILCSADYYFNTNFIEDYSNRPKENILIFNALINANKLLKERTINALKLNNYGDLVLNIGADIRIEIYIDVSENEQDYYTFYGNNGRYFSLIKNDNQLLFIEDFK